MRPGRLFGATVLLTTTALAMALFAPAGAAVATETGALPGATSVNGLVLWNHLGSSWQLQHSVAGAALTQVGTVWHPAGVRGKAATSIGDQSYLSVSQRGFFGADRNQGTVEIFLQKRMPVSVPFETPLPAVFGVRPYDGEAWGPIDAYWSDGFTGDGGLQFEITDVSGVTHKANDLGWDAVRVGRWVHVMFVWDINGIRGTADRLRIYREGQLVATNTDTITAIRTADGPVKVLANHAYDRLGKPALIGDELLVWAWPVTP